MAIAAKDVPITREETYGWLQEYDGQIRDTKKLRDYVAEKIIDKDLDPNEMVNTTTNDSLSDETSVLDMIMLDIESYG
jgi:hypothetical protein